MSYKTAFKAAFPHTIPVMTGYLVLGMAFGVLAQSAGYDFLWAGLMSVIVFAGSMQFVAVSLLTGPFNLAGAAFMTLMVNIRHIFYGFSLLGKYRNLGAKKPYMIFALTDETFSLLCSVQPPEGVDEGRFYFGIALLNQSYWVIGSVAGGLVGAALAFNAKGIDFAMTALFVVVFTEHFRQIRNRIPALIGLCGSALCLIIFGSQNFILLSMLLMTAVFTAFREPIEKGVDAR